MADETRESLSFHEMGLDDRLVKVKSIFKFRRSSEMFFNVSVAFWFYLSGDCKAELVSTIANPGWSNF